MSGYLAMARSVQSDPKGVDDSLSVQHRVCDRSDISDQSQKVDVETLKDHLAILYKDIRTGCLLGLHQYLARVPAEIVRSIIAAAGPETDEATFHTLCQRAGDAALRTQIRAIAQRRGLRLPDHWRTSGLDERGRPVVPSDKHREALEASSLGREVLRQAPKG